ncbi:MAG: single-stranded-DNA-specific exonuclease RecJ [Pedobacter sp.]|nr:MAG: single-stranded-DNA-specific exonuclease RecJ [Pedobacter sp.]
MTKIEKRWVLKEPAEQSLVEKLQAELKIEPSLCALLVQRNIHSFDSARDFFRPQIGHLHDPFLMKGMEQAVIRIKEALEKNQRILIYGDYDVDGTTSVALMYQFLNQFTTNLLYYIPDRHAEGYGISEQGIQFAAVQNCHLIIALDCGIRSVDKVALASSLGIDFIIADHHLPGQEIPAAIAVLDPKQTDCAYPFKELSGCGIGFKIAQAFAILENLTEDTYLQYLDLVALSIGADLVAMQDENRILAHYGLKKINTSPCPGIRVLIEQSGRSLPLSMSDVVFQLAPPINAAGRMGHALDALALLLSNSQDAQQKASKILNQNTQRKEDDQEITAAALSLIEHAEDFTQKKTTVVYHESWNKGIIGIVASRLTETYYRPTVVLTASNGKYTGSARSVIGFDLYEALVGCADLLEQFGGHKFAAGLTLAPENLNAFANRFEEVVSNSINPHLLLPEIHIDLCLILNQIDAKFYRILTQMGPFGPEHTCPLFMSTDLVLAEKPQILGNKHLKLKVKQQNSIIFDVIAFGQAGEYQQLCHANSFSMCYQIEENIWRNKSTLQLNAKAFKF